MIGTVQIIKMANSYLKGRPAVPEIVTQKNIIVLDIDYCLYQNTALEEVETNHSLTQQRLLFGTDGDSYETLRQVYGSSKRGLKEKYGLTFDRIKHHDYLDSYKFLKADPELRRLLMQIPLEKYCLTNGFKEKAERILDRLGICDCITKVYCVDDNDEVADWILKPFSSAYNFVMADLGACPKSSQVYFFDDSQVNLDGASKMGWITKRISKEFTIHQALEEFIDTYRLPYGIGAKQSDEVKVPGGCMSSNRDDARLPDMIKEQA